MLRQSWCHGGEVPRARTARLKAQGKEGRAPGPRSPPHESSLTWRLVHQRGGLLRLFNASFIGQVTMAAVPDRNRARLRRAIRGHRVGAAVLPALCLCRTCPAIAVTRSVGVNSAVTAGLCFLLPPSCRTDPRPRAHPDPPIPRSPGKSTRKHERRIDARRTDASRLNSIQFQTEPAPRVCRLPALERRLRRPPTQTTRHPRQQARSQRGMAPPAEAGGPVASVAFGATTFRPVALTATQRLGVHVVALSSVTV